MAGFYQIAGFARVIGAIIIDGCLIPIRGPDREEHLCVCHKGFHAIMSWQCAIHTCHSQNLSAHGMAQCMILQFSMPVTCM